MQPRTRSSASVRYAFDESNRLVVRQAGDSLDGLRPTRVVEGRVTVGRRNRLVYRVDSSAQRNGAARPHRYHLDGTWSLTRDHDLKLTLHEAGRARRQNLFLKGEIVKVRAHALTFALKRHALDGRRTAQRLSLRGRWEADRRNRLTFLAEKADGSEDRLTFQSGWSVDRRHTLRYRYRQQAGKRRMRALHTVRYAGRWDITRASHLVYRVDGSTDSVFAFRASLQSPSLNARRGRMVYQVGIGLADGRRRTQRVTLFGKWKLNRDLSVSFEIPYAKGRREAIRFQGKVTLTSRDAVSVKLLSRRRKPLGISVTFSRRWVDDAQLFLRLHRAGQDAEAIAGVHVRF